jgi:hypothetical protein
MKNKNQLMHLLEPHFHQSLSDRNYAVQNVRARNLLTYNRFDLAFKILYLEFRDKRVKFAKEIYKEHIRALSLGKFTEPGNPNKVSFQDFVDDFEKTFVDLELNGFDDTKSLIPLSENGTIANGAHRVACAIHLDQDVKTVALATQDHVYDYKFFYARNIPSEILDIAALKFIETANRVHIAFIWPTAQGHDDKIETIIPNIIYRKNVSLNYNGAHNLLSQVYAGEPWLGDPENNFQGIKGKIVECFKSNKPLRVIAFQSRNLAETIKIKDKVRKLFNIGKHSIHITDTHQEATTIARCVFNNNSIHFLNYGQPNKYLCTRTNMLQVEKFAKSNQIDVKNVLLDSGMVLSAYGLRKAFDVDGFLDSSIDGEIENGFMEIHDEELGFHCEVKDELIHNPKFYFQFGNMKFVSFDQVYRFKKNRNEVKDRNDCGLMEALIENNSHKKVVAKIRQNIFYGLVKSRSAIILLLKKFGLFRVAKVFYNMFKFF